jgi:hypothetical protein
MTTIRHDTTQKVSHGPLVVSLFATYCALLWPSSSFAAPNFTHLFPAGGQRGSTVEITAAGTFDVWPVQIWVSGRGVTVEPATDKGKFRVTIADDATPGVYWLRPYDATGGGNLRPFLVGTLPEVNEVEPNDEPSKPQKLPAAGVVVNGRLQRNGDVDCYAVPLTKGQTLIANLEAHTTLRSPMDGVLQIVSTDGFVLAQDNDTRGLDPRIVFTAPVEGTYVVRVFAFPATPDSSIRFSGGDAFIYRLTVTTGGFADFPLPLAVEQGKSATVTLTGWNLPDSARAIAVQANDLDAEEVTVCHPDVANPVRLRVEPHRTFDATGLKPVPTPLRSPVSVTARVEKPGGAVQFAVLGQKGKPLIARAEANAFGLPLLPTVRVLDAAGKQLARGEPGKLNEDATVRFTPPADGEYAIEVRDLHGHGGEQFAFLLRVEPDVPDFSLSAPADRFTVTPGKPTDVAVTVNRLGGFNQEIELFTEGLPPGLTAEMVSADGKAPKAITLRLTAEEAGLAGTFRIVGRPKGNMDTVRVARATLAEFAITTPDLWITASEAASASPPASQRRR